MYCMLLKNGSNYRLDADLDLVIKSPLKWMKRSLIEM